MQIIRDCRNQRVSATHPQGTTFCLHCRHYALTETQKDICSCCGNNIIRKHLRELRNIDEVVSENEKIIISWIENPTQGNNPIGFEIKVSKFSRHLVPIRFLAQFYQMRDENCERYESLLNQIKACPQLMPGTSLK